MAFEIGDTVLYGIDGVCKITDIVRKNFKGRMINYYVLHPVFNDRSVLYVPKDNKESVARMRHALTSRQIKLIFKKTPNRQCKWIENENERKAYFKEILYGGDSKELVKLVKTLYLHQKKQQSLGKKMHMSDEKFFKDAERLLYEECAVAFKITPAEVFPYLQQMLK